MTVKLNFSDDAYTCTLPKDSGSCDNKIFRYYYNAIEVSQEEVMSCCLSRPFFLISSSRSYHHYFQRRCKLFVYGGCKGNGNNFVSEVQCLQKCGDEADLALLPQVEITTEIGKKKKGDSLNSFFARSKTRIRLYTNQRNLHNQNIITIIKDVCNSTITR